MRTSRLRRRSPATEAPISSRVATYVVKPLSALQISLVQTVTTFPQARPSSSLDPAECAEYATLTSSLRESCCSSLPCVIKRECKALTRSIAFERSLYRASDTCVASLRSSVLFWAQVLHGCGDESFATQGEIDYHDCFTKNLSAVEEHFTHTHLFKLVNPNKLAPIGHLEYHWLTPGDCARKDAEISSGLDFNGANGTSCT